MKSFWMLGYRVRFRARFRLVRLAAVALAAALMVPAVSPVGAATGRSGSGSAPDAPCIGAGCLTFQGNLVWESALTVGDKGSFFAFGGTLSDSGFSWRGATYSVAGVFLARSPSDPQMSYISIHFVPELPVESRRLRLRIGGAGLDLADGDFGNGNYLWSDVGLDWGVGETIEVDLREFPAQLEHRSIDGRGNNFGHLGWGTTNTAQIKIAPVSFVDGVSTPTGSRPNPRRISNLVSVQQGSVPNSVGASDMVWQWGQFLDHDIVLSVDDPTEPLPIPVPLGDPDFDPAGTGQAVISFDRSAFDPTTGTAVSNPRRQTNSTTAFIDASQVYGPDESRALALRTSDGTGRLKTSHGGRLLPFNDLGLANDGGSDVESLFVAGDVRVNEQVGLTAVHTLFVREHNRLAGIIAAQDPDLSGEEIYQLARRIVGAQMQAITFNEFLPVLLGPDSIDPYSGYNPSVDPAIASEFSAAGFRVGHTMLSPNLLVIDADGQQDHISLTESFFNPSFVVEHDISTILRGLAAQEAQQVDLQVIDEVRNLLIKAPNGPVFDLASLNIHRGRDHGVGDYNTVRRAYGLAPAGNFADISSNPNTQQTLMSVYGNVHDMDLWVAALTEDHITEAMVGETLRAVIADQFHRLRDGDRFWFENDPYFLANPKLLDEVRNTTLADIIRRNTPIEDEIQTRVFLTGPNPVTVPTTSTPSTGTNTNLVATEPGADDTDGKTQSGDGDGDGGEDPGGVDRVDCEDLDTQTPFVDVSPTSPTAKAIACTYGLGITSGTTPTTYSPAANVTRAQMAVFLARLYKAATGTDAQTVDTPFSDVAPTDPASDDIARIYGLGITSGTTPTSYSPAANVTRAQMAVFLARLYKAATGTDAQTVDTPFSDVAPTDPASDDIARIYGLGITTGTTPTTYSPAANVTRAQMAVFLTHLYNAITTTDTPITTTTPAGSTLPKPRNSTTVNRTQPTGPRLTTNSLHEPR